jgi:hypothetical protein
MKRKNTESFVVKYKDTDLWIAVDRPCFYQDLPREVLEWVKELRSNLESFIKNNKAFLKSLKPVKINTGAPKIALEMSIAAKSAEVGPMAAVAGAFSQEIGQKLKKEKNAEEVIVENGGDLYVDVKNEITIGVYAGDSPLSDKIGIKILSDNMPLGICTSAGTVGPSLSFGKAHAVVVVSDSSYYADAYATAVGNMITSVDDINDAVQKAQKLPKLNGILIILGDKLGVWGEIQLVSLN